MTIAQAATKLIAIVVAAWLCTGVQAMAQATPTSAVCPPAPAAFPPALLQKAAAQAQDRGPLWRISKSGHSSYLYGTLHLGRAEWMAPGPLLAAALNDTDTLALELDPLDETVQRDMAAGIAKVQVWPLPTALRERLVRLLEAQCMPTDAVDATPAELQVLSLVALAGRRDGLEPSYGSEIMLSIMARGSAQPVVSLETVAQQLRVLLVGSTAEAQILVHEELDELEHDSLRQILRQLVQVWEQGDMETLARYNEWCQCVNTPTEKAQMRRMLDERNPGMAQRIDMLHTGGKKLLVAVGSLHMAGPQGLPALLTQRGYRLERLR